jgi:predicted nucleic acid-binding protein
MDQSRTAVIDACVLYSAPVRDLVVRLAQAGLVRARWTADIHEEWMRNVLSNNPQISRSRLERTRSLMDQAVRDCLVTSYGELIDSLVLPDPDDRHVLAAAIQGEAEIIVTFNLADFPSDALAQHNIQALHPDEFFSQLFDSAADEFCLAAQLQRQSLKNPPKSVEEFLTTLEAVGLPQTSARLRGCAERI